MTKGLDFLDLRQKYASDDFHSRLARLNGDPRDIYDPIFQHNTHLLLGKLKGLDGRVFHPTRAQVELLNLESRYQVWLMGRRAGKSTCAAIRAIMELMKPGKRIWVVAPYFDLTEKIYRIIHGYATRCVPYMIDGQPKNSKNGMEIKFITGSELICKSAEKPDQLIGESLDLAIIDEAGVVKDQAIEYLLPALNDVDPVTGKAKGRLIAVSTPRLPNWFKTMYESSLIDPMSQIEQDGEVLYQSYRASSFTNPWVDPMLSIAEMRRKPEGLARQEYLAEWMEEGGLVFPIMKSMLYAPGFRSVRPGQTTYIGIDLARANDYTVMFGMNSRYEQVVFYRETKSRWSTIMRNIKEQIDELAKTGAVVACVDATGPGDAIYESLHDYFRINPRVKIIPINFSKGQKVKSDMIEDLKLDVSDNLLKFWNYPDIYDEFSYYSFVEGRNGIPIYGAPEGEDYHDDIVTAVALAVHAIKQPSPFIV